ncbi:MAG: hypothetical protein NT069_04910 [Planctomycetota bacterium]|nr:hypothetical protein [Planctomycetota bacterium]
MAIGSSFRRIASAWWYDIVKKNCSAKYERAYLNAPPWLHAAGMRYKLSDKSRGIAHGGPACGLSIEAIRSMTLIANCHY